MILDLQFKLKNNKDHIIYLRNHSYWYKILNRNPNSYKDFISEYKDYNYKQRNEKISKTLDYIEMLTALMSNLK